MNKHFATATFDASRWEIIDVSRSDQSYRARSWNYEFATRIVAKSGMQEVEASIFDHFKDRRHVKTVIELPTSFGCVMRCPYCAAGGIPEVRTLSAQDILNVYSLVANYPQRSFDPSIVSFAGIGESSLNVSAVMEAARRISVDADRPLKFMFTTVGIKPDFILRVDRQTDVDVSVLQITLVHHDSKAVRERFGAAFRTYSFEEICQRIADTRHLRIRLNFVAIRDFNDSPAVYEQLIDVLKPLQDKIQVRVSALNETMFGLANGCQPTDEPTLDTICRSFSEAGIASYVFKSARNDHMNCGQLLHERPPAPLKRIRIAPSAST